MTHTRKIEAWIALLVAVALLITLVVNHWPRRKEIILQGAVLVQDSDPRKQRPVAGVAISAGDLATSDTVSDASGLFVLRLRKPIRNGHAIVISFRHAQYQPLYLNDFVTSKLYVVHLVPVANVAAPGNQPQVSVANVRVRYTVKALDQLNVGSAVKIFEIQNKSNVPCKGGSLCSPDGKWKAASGTATLDAGPGNAFRNARSSCIAGPCPFTKIEGDRLSQADQIVTATARDWSDTATFLLEAEVFRPVMSQMEHWSYPVVFGEGLSFTLPSAAESVSIEAELDKQTIIFPLGPSLFLSWATCNTEVNPDKSRIYRCAPKPGYRFQ
jgi:hypothetical protein